MATLPGLNSKSAGMELNRRADGDISQTAPDQRRVQPTPEQPDVLGYAWLLIEPRACLWVLQRQRREQSA